MNAIRKISKKWYVRQIITCYLVFWLVFGTVVIRADVNPGANVLPSGVISSVGVNPPDYTTPGKLSMTQTASEAIINWQNFDIGADGTVQFFQPGSAAAALNRIHDGNPTGIMGSLIANGRIFIVNPAGVVFGSGAAVNVTQLIASSHDIENADFLNGIYDFAAPGIGEIHNYGTIEAEEGVALIGKKVLNTGTISAGNGGFVVMAAGDRVLLGEPGSKIIVEMSAATIPQGNNAEGIGDVINEGQIEAPGGTIVLAAGDIFSAAAELDSEPVRVLSGLGMVQQDGTISADGTTGDGGSVTLTAGDMVVLTADSLTSANAGTSSDAGEVVVASPDTVVIQDNAQIEAMGGSVPDGDGLVATNVAIEAGHFTFAGDIDATAPSGKKGEILVSAFYLNIADGPIPADPVDNTLYEQWIEATSQAGTNLELVATSSSNGNIIVEHMSDGEITGGSGDFALRTVFNTGGITFLPAVAGQLVSTTVHTTAGFEEGGGSIFMLAGSGGITTGDLITDVLSRDKVSDPGRIRLLATNGGDVETGTMYVKGGSNVEISAIATGDLTVHGAAVSKTNQVPSDTKDIGFAQICLVAVDNLFVDAAEVPRGVKKEITVDAHGKIETVGDIRICAGKDITIQNLDGGINASAKTSQNTTEFQTAETTVYIVAGGNKEGPGVISINGSTTVVEYPVTLKSSTSGSGSPLVTSPTDTDDLDGNGDPWDDTKEKAGDYRVQVKLIIDNDSPVPPGHPDSPCADCPKPPELPEPIPPLALPDAESDHMDNSVAGNVLDNDTPPPGDTLTVIDFTQPSNGTVIVNEDGSFTYTPNPGFVGEDSFTYIALDGGVVTEPILVTITLTNALPVADDGSASGHMNILLSGNVNFGDTPDNQAAGEIDPLIVLITVEPTHGDVTFNTETGNFVYTPTDPGFIGTDMFTYSVDDGQQGADPAEGLVTITLTNALPVAGDGSASGHMDIPLSGSVSFGDTPDSQASGEIDPLTVLVTTEPTHGDVSFNTETGSFTYTPTDPGFTGTDAFVYSVDDGQQGAAPAEGTVNITLTNALPVASDSTEAGHMGNNITAGLLFADTPDNLASGEIDAVTAELVGAVGGVLTTALGGTVTLDGDGTEFTYTPPAPGFTGTDSFQYTVTDPEGVIGDGATGTVLLLLNNTLPIALDDLASTQQSVAVVINVLANDSDPDGDPITLISFTNPLDGVLTQNSDGTFTYTPDNSFTGVDSFDYFITDGQLVNFPGQEVVLVDASGIITVNVIPPPPPPAPLSIPAAPLRVIEPLVVSGCPFLMDTVAAELDIPTETIHVSVRRAVAAAPNIQPCNACENLTNYAQILRDSDGSNMTALAGVFNNIAPVDAPFTPEMEVAIAAAFAERIGDIESPRYAEAMEYIDAFVGYVTVLDEQLNSPVDDSVAFVMEKYGAPIMENENANIAAFLTVRLEALETLGG